MDYYNGRSIRSSMEQGLYFGSFGGMVPFKLISKHAELSAQFVLFAEDDDKCGLDGGHVLSNVAEGSLEHLLLL
jgi:hypothetical protein